MSWLQEFSPKKMPSWGINSLSSSTLSLAYYTTSYQMCHIWYWIKLDRELDHMPMVLLVQHKPSPLSNWQNNCKSYLSNTQWLDRLLLWLLLLPKRRKYTPCWQLTQRPPSSLKGRKNNAIRVKGIKNPLIILARALRKNGRWGIRATCVWKTTRPIFVLDLQRPKSLSHSNNRQCWLIHFNMGKI